MRCLRGEEEAQRAAVREGVAKKRTSLLYLIRGCRYSIYLIARVSRTRLYIPYTRVSLLYIPHSEGVANSQPLLPYIMRKRPPPVLHTSNDALLPPSCLS